jgi:hypothetical protein
LHVEIDRGLAVSAAAEAPPPPDFSGGMSRSASSPAGCVYASAKSFARLAARFAHLELFSPTWVETGIIQILYILSSMFDLRLQQMFSTNLALIPFNFIWLKKDCLLNCFLAF